jgi:hypothetical protein
MRDWLHVYKPDPPAYHLAIEAFRLCHEEIASWLQPVGMPPAQELSATGHSGQTARINLLKSLGRLTHLLERL